MINSASLDSIDQFEVCYQIEDEKPATISLADNVLEDTMELIIDGEHVCSGEQLVF